MKRCILVVDDSLAIRKAIRRILEPLGYAVEEAADGAQALAWVRGHAVDAILCDIDMPEMDGLAFLRAYRAERGAAGVPVIMCTTHASFEKITEAIGAGANEYVMKPFDADIVGGKLKAVGIAA
jgi:two-component system chemotaxis response regulator CheY